MNHSPGMNNSPAQLLEPVRIVVIATYNERKNIPSLIVGILKFQPEFQVLIVDDNSPDGTAEVVVGLADKNERVHILRRPGKLGYGTAVMAGFREAIRLGGERIFTMDADHSHDPRALISLDRALGEHDMVIGSRYLRGIWVMSWSPGRLSLSLGANAYIRFVLRLNYTDCTSGFRGYRERAVKRLIREPILSSGYAFLAEVLVTAHRSGFSLSGRCRLSIPSVAPANRRCPGPISGKPFIVLGT